MITDYKQGRYVPQTISYVPLMKRRVKKHSSYIQPIFEAVSNALEATSGKEDYITIKLKVSKSSVPNKYIFCSIAIEDTGCGLDKENIERFYNLFDESKNFNNLGSGRIQFLHFFNHTEFRTVYMDEGHKKKRSIVLSTNFINKEKTPIWEGFEEDATEEEQTGTIVEFFFPRDEKDKVSYEELTTDELHDRIFTHYLGKFCINKGNIQNIIIERYIYDAHVKDEDRFIQDEDIPLVDYQDEVKIHYKKINSTSDGLIELKETETFKVDSYLLPSAVQKKNEIKLTSKNETVEADNIDFSFVSRARIEEGKNMLCLISSDFLTKQDTDLRGKLSLYTKSQFLKDRNLFDYDQSHIFIDDVQEGVTEKIIKHYPSINKIKEDSQENIDQLVEDFSLDKNVVASIGRRTGEKSSDFLERYYHSDADIQKDNTLKLKDIIDSLRSLDPSGTNFRRKFKAKVKEINELIPVKNKSDLSRYISSRKSAMNMLDLILKRELDCQIETKKRRNNEKLIHDLLFEQGSMDTLESNLWMLNEDFIHFKGFSNFELRKLNIEGETIIRDNLNEEEVAQLTNYHKDMLGNKPDILLFPEDSKCIIIELKSDTADPTHYLNQAVNYAGLIREFSKDEYIINNFYVYLIGENFDFNSVVRTDTRFQLSEHLDYVFMPNVNVHGGKRGYGSLYMEVLKYSTLLERAKLRNSIFTEKLFGKEDKNI